MFGLASRISAEETRQTQHITNLYYSYYRDDGLGPPRNAFASTSMGGTGRMGGFSASGTQSTSGNNRNNRQQREDTSWGPSLLNNQNNNNNQNNIKRKNNNNNDNNNAPEWFVDDSKDGSGFDGKKRSGPLSLAEGGGGDAGHSVQEFELWRAKMKAQEMRKAGYDVPEPQLSDFTPGDTAKKQKEDISAPKGSGVDRLFGMWDNPKLSSTTSGGPGVVDFISGSSISSIAPSGHASRFSSFFRSEPESTGGSVAPPSSAPTTPNGNNFPPVPTPSLNNSSSTSAQSLVPPVKEDADKQGFQRIMAMLGTQDHEGPIVSQTDATESSLPQQSDPVSVHPATPASPVEPITNRQAISPKKDNDLFFMSLLNKSSSASEGPSTTQSPLVLDNVSITSSERTSSLVPSTKEDHIPQPIETSSKPPDNSAIQLESKNLSQHQLHQQTQQPQHSPQHYHQPHQIPPGLQNTVPAHIPPGFPPHQYPPPPPPGWFIDQNGKPNFPPDFIPPPLPPNFNANQPGPLPPGFPPFFGGIPPPGFDPRQQGFPHMPPPPLNADGTPRFPFPTSRDHIPH